MTEAKRKAKILLLEQNKTFADLAREAELALATVHNVLDGRKSSKKSKQAITNALGAEIFDGVSVTERQMIWYPGEVEIESPTIEAAITFAQQFPPGTIRRRGRIVQLVRPMKISLPTRTKNNEQS
jgi:hypothetical protein